MKKGIVEIEMPETCFECPFRYDADKASIGLYEFRQLHKCLIAPNEHMGEYLADIMDKRQEWCQIKQKPDPKILELQMVAGLAYGAIDLQGVLKPCRICGGKPKVLEMFTKYKAKCKVCGCSATAETKIDLVKLWNGRQRNGK